MSLLSRVLTLNFTSTVWLRASTTGWSINLITASGFRKLVSLLRFPPGAYGPWNEASSEVIRVVIGRTSHLVCASWAGLGWPLAAVSAQDRRPDEAQAKQLCDKNNYLDETSLVDAAKGRSAGSAGCFSPFAES